MLAVDNASQPRAESKPAALALSAAGTERIIRASCSQGASVPDTLYMGVLRLKAMPNRDASCN